MRQLPGMTLPVSGLRASRNRDHGCAADSVEDVRRYAGHALDTVSFQESLADNALGSIAEERPLWEDDRNAPVPTAIEVTTCWTRASSPLLSVRSTAVSNRFPSTSRSDELI